MQNHMLSCGQIELKYHATVLYLYNLALYTVGDKRLAEQAAAQAFSDAFIRIRGNADVQLFEAHCLRRLYMFGKKSHRLSDNFIGCKAHDRLTELLISLSFQERYILLLFCWRKFTIHQIAKTTRLPQFIIEKRLNTAVNKAMSRIA